MFMNRRFNTYKSLISILKSVLGNDASTFMNYGFWDKPHASMTLRDANKRMCKKIFQRGDLKSAKTILDIGCGYGDQDFYWASKTNARIEGVDIDETSVRDATKKAKLDGLSDRIRFETGDACMIDRKSNKYDRVVSLESAFHYDTREKFFKEAHRVLKKGGKLVLADILYNDDESSVSWFNRMNRDAFSELFSIPDANKIGMRECVRQLEEVGFRVKMEDVTEHTFKPYYQYFFDNVTCPDDFGLPVAVFNVLRYATKVYINTLCGGTNGFKYVIAVCEKK